MEIAKPTVANVSMASANTEYSYTLPDGTKLVRIKLRNNESFGKLAVDEGQSGTTYITINQGETIEQPIKAGGATLYFQSDNDSDTAEILSFK